MINEGKVSSEKGDEVGVIEVEMRVCKTIF